jgi:hypothetical protein
MGKTPAVWGGFSGTTKVVPFHAIIYPTGSSSMLASLEQRVKLMLEAENRSK